MQHRGRARRFASDLLPMGECTVMCAMKRFCCKNYNKYEISINCLVNSGKWEVEHKYGTLEMRPTQVTSERCLAKAFKILHFRGKRMPSIQIKSKSFLEHNVYLGKTLSDFPFVVTLMFMHRHWSPTHFRLFLCIRFQNIRPVFGKFSLSVFFSPNVFFLLSWNFW